MFVELHIIQNFAPSNLNRDDTGSPKDAEFGGFRRARLSSQCLKRATRTMFRDAALVAPDDRAIRTKRLKDAISDQLASMGRDRDAAARVAEAAISVLGLKVVDGAKTEYLLFLGQREIEAIVQDCEAHWAALLGATDSPVQTEGKKSKKQAKGAVSPEVAKAFIARLDGGRARDLALFGRMLADLPDRNIHAASQVAHALSTHRVSMEFDYYTAVDDLKPDDTAGADMIGTVEFNSACFYRYANVSLGQLVENLGGHRQDAVETALAFVRAFVLAIPTGKQNSMAAQNPPSLVLVVVRRHGLWSLSNAFVKPVRATQDEDLVQASIRAMGAHWRALRTMYGSESIVGAWLCSTEGDGATRFGVDEEDGVTRVATLGSLVENVGASLVVE